MKDRILTNSLLGLMLALLLLLVLFSLDLISKAKRVPSVEESGRKRSKLTALQKGFGDAAAPREVAFQPVASDRDSRAFDPYRDWDTGKVLDHFAVPATEFDGLLLSQALDLLRERYQEFGGTNLEFRIEGADPGFPLKFKTRGSLRRVLELMAGVGGFDLEIRQGMAVFTRKPAGADRLEVLRLDGQLEARAYGEALSRMGSVDWTDPYPHLPQGDPSQAEIEERDRQIRERFFAAYGIEFGDGASLEVDPESGDWILTHSPDQLERIRAIYVDQINPSQLHTPQILLSFQNGVSEAAVPFEARTFADAESFEETRRELVDGAGGRGVTAPSIVTTDGQRAKIQIVREVIYPTEFDAHGAPSVYDVRNVGLTIEVEPVLAGIDRVLLLGQVEYLTLGDQKLVDLFEEDPNTWPSIPVDGSVMRTTRAEDFHPHTTSFEGQLIDGNVTGFVAADDGESLVKQFITSQRIDEAGTPLMGGP